MDASAAIVAAEKLIFRSLCDEVSVPFNAPTLLLSYGELDHTKLQSIAAKCSSH